MDIKYLLVAGVSATVGYYFAQTRLEKQYYTKLIHETNEARDHYRRKYKEKAAEEGEDPGVTDAAVDADEALQKYSGLTIGPSVLTQEMTEAVERAVEQGELDGWDQSVVAHVAEKAYTEAKAEVEELEKITTPVVKESLLKAVSQEPVQYNKISTQAKAEEPKVDTTRPHVITANEYINSETGLKQRSVTYFAGDDVLMGETENIVENAIRMYTLGKDILQQLKDGLGDTDTIYVRSPEAGYEFEIVRSEGTHAQEVLGEGYETG